MYKYKIGIIENQKQPLNLIMNILQNNNYTQYMFIPIEEKNIGKKVITNEEFDAVVLNINNSNAFALDICKKVRSKSSVPIIGVLSNTTSGELLKGMWSGVDGFISHSDTPDTIVEKLTTIIDRKCILRNKTINDLSWNLDKLEVKYNHQVIDFSPKELILLGLLLSNANDCLTKEELLLLLWGDKEFINKKVVGTTVNNIRKKLKLSSFPVNDHLITIRGLGYKWSHSL
jgi:DNA-binding response OmpR family regulator